MKKTKSPSAESRNGKSLSFLRLLYGNDAPGYLVLWTAQDKCSLWTPAQDLSGVARNAIKLSRDKDVYFGIGIQPADLGVNKRGQADKVAAIPGLWADIDIYDEKAHKDKSLPPTRDDALDILRAFPLKPSVIIQSGHGLQVWWLFLKLWIFKDDEERQEAQALSRRFQATLQAIAQKQSWNMDNTSDLARVLRLPGTQNRKIPDEPALVHILMEKPRRYAPSEFEPHLREPEPKAKSAIDNDGIIAEGARNVRLTRIAGGLRRNGVEREALEQSLLSINEAQCNPPLDEKEVRDIARSVSRYAPGDGSFTSKARLENKSKDEGNGPLPRGAGQTEKLANTIINGDYFAKDAGRRLYVYRDGVYRPNGEEYVRMRVRELLEAAAAKWTPYCANAVVEYITVGVDDLLECPLDGRLNLRNKLVVLTEGDDIGISEWNHNPAYLTQVQLPVTIDPEAKCPKFDRFVSEVFPQDAVKAGVPYKIFAWMMAPNVVMQKALLLYGEGESGKSSYLSVLRAFLGLENVSALSLHQIVNERFAVAGLVGKLANICPDIPSRHLKDASIFKIITDGKEALKGEYKFKPPFDFVPFARLAFSVNKIPTSDDDTHGFMRRWLVIPFKKRIPPEKNIPRDKLQAMLTTPQELSGILNKALAVWEEVRERGVPETPSMRKAWEEMQRFINPMEEWLSERTTESPMARIQGNRLYADYQSFCEEAGIPPLPRRDHTARLKQMRPRLTLRKSTGGYMRWSGIDLLSGEVPL